MSWDDQRRRLDTILAVAPTYNPYFDTWVVEELVFRGDEKPTWRIRYIPSDNGFGQLDHHDELEVVRSHVEILNHDLLPQIDNIMLSGEKHTSLRLKVDKFLQAKKRLFDEERLFVNEAIARDNSRDKPKLNDINLDPKSEVHRDELFEKLQKLPSLKIVAVGRRGQRRIIFNDGKGFWSKPYYITKRWAKTAYRARIANPFGLSESSHWGKTKSAIRKILLPRANELLQLAHVQRLLSEALASGKKALVCNGMVFWYEETGGIGWQVKEASYGGGQDGEAIWIEGTIESRNHGRLVILPYIKSSGEKVRGHTRNAPNDGRAKPRHPDHYLDIPFEILEGDLMIELMGHLPYD